MLKQAILRKIVTFLLCKIFVKGHMFKEKPYWVHFGLRRDICSEKKNIDHGCKCLIWMLSSLDWCMCGLLKLACAQSQGSLKRPVTAQATGRYVSLAGHDLRIWVSAIIHRPGLQLPLDSVTYKDENLRMENILKVTINKMLKAKSTKLTQKEYELL